jgi:hypothetical protein
MQKLMLGKTLKLKPTLPQRRNVDVETAARGARSILKLELLLS